ncbi:hypothetical protein LCGC14_2158750 [marine sediment metagenome]|uniref:LamG-like jellyroll fold domain-containing protein n=1 Tax=marine sediment metagenome TaxID=412755 RepID=A0A0F9DT97_9ZZZZ
MPVVKLTRGRFGEPTAEQKLLWCPIYEGILGIVGPTGVIIPMGDTNHENAGRTTCTGIGDEQPVFTYSEAVTAFDTPPYFLGPARIPIICFNGTDEEADTPDAAFWSRDDAGGANGFSLRIWANITAIGASRCFIAKYDETSSLREWILFHNANHTMRLFLFDESADEDAYRDSDSAITMGSLHQFAATYDGRGSAAAADGITLYEDGVVIASSPSGLGSYVGMEDLGGAVTLGRNVGGERFFPGEMAGGPLGPLWVPGELTADQVLRLYQHERVALGV